MLFYPVGSFFWAKTKAIRPLFEMGMTYASFDKEEGQMMVLWHMLLKELLPAW